MCKFYRAVQRWTCHFPEKLSAGLFGDAWCTLHLLLESKILEGKIQLAAKYSTRCATSHEPLHFTDSPIKI